MYGINKRYPAYKVKMELRNKQRRAQEQEYLERLAREKAKALHGSDDKRYAPFGVDDE